MSGITVLSPLRVNRVGSQPIAARPGFKMM